MKRIGIFAGTFDPIHAGHIAFAEAALETGLTKVMFLVEPRPRRKQGVHAQEHRIRMVELAVKDNDKFGVIVLEQARFTPHETLPVLQNRFKGFELTLMFGDDVVSHMIDHISDWPHLEELLGSTQLIVAARLHDQPELASRLDTLQKTIETSFSYTFVTVNHLGVSSSAIRQALREGNMPQGLLPQVSDYIQANNLYSPGDKIS